MLIAIDYDQTWTADPELWALFTEQAKARGHRVIIVTARRNTEENQEILHDVIVQHAVVFTSLASKIEHMARIGYKPDIWIDDDPRTLVYGH